MAKTNCRITTFIDDNPSRVEYDFYDQGYQLPNQTAAEKLEQYVREEGIQYEDFATIQPTSRSITIKQKIK